MHALRAVWLPPTIKVLLLMQVAVNMSGCVAALRAWVDTDVDMTDFFTMGMPAVVDMLQASGRRVDAGVCSSHSVAWCGQVVQGGK